MKIKLKQGKRTVLRSLATASLKKKLRIIDRLDGLSESDTIKILLKILEDESWVLREKAAYKIAQFGKRVVPRLEKLLVRGFWYSRAAALLALGEIGSLKLVPSIIDILLTDDNPTVKKEASASLVKIARRDPTSFVEILRSIHIDESKMLRILIIIESQDAEIYSLLKEAMYYE